MISIIGVVESVSVAQTLAARRRQSIAPDQELIGLGAANVAAVSGGYPVTGGFARSVVNFDAGAETPAAGAFTAGGIALASLFLTPLLYHLPIATLAATMSIAGRAVSSLIQDQGVGDLYLTYATTERDGVDFNLAYIPASFDVPLPEPFGQHYMQELFKLGYGLARSGYPWHKPPPGY